MQRFVARDGQAVMSTERPHVLDDEGMQTIKAGFRLILLYRFPDRFSDIVKITFVRNRFQYV